MDQVSMLVFRNALIIAVLMMPLGCATVHPTPPTAVAGIFDDRNDGIRFEYPGNWALVKGETAVFKVVAPIGNGSLSLDVPSLPPFAGLGLTPRRAADGYIDDFKKNRVTDATVDENAELIVAGETSQRVKLSGHLGGKPAIDVAVFLVHGEKLFILSCDSDDNGYATARKALDDAVASVQWIK
jgi:hypothetical protein